MQAIRWWAALALAAAALLGTGQPVRAHGFQQHCFTGQSDGRRTCNCSELEAEVQLCHMSSASVTIGSRHLGSFSTGVSSSTCHTVKLPPGKCVWIRYRFQCCPTLFSWNCTATGNSIHSASAGTGEC